MLEQLDIKKTMYFKNNSPELSYDNALKQLANDIGQPQLTLVELEQTIFNALSEAAVRLNSKEKLHEKNSKILLAFYKWVQNIHNDNLAPPTGARFPNNIVYDILSLLRNKKTLTEQETLVRFFLEGANARKISNGKTPQLDFIATSLAIDAVVAVKSFTMDLSESANQFFHQYSSLSNFISAQKSLEALATKLKEDALYGFLSNKELFTFQRQKNEETGANRYLFDQAIDNGILELKNYNCEINAAMESMVTTIESLYPPILAEFETAHRQSTPEAYCLAKWDASEWFSRLYAALSIAAQYNPDYSDYLERFMNNEMLKAIILESTTGNFPAKERNKKLATMEITELFSQQQLETLAMNKAPITLMWQSGNTINAPIDTVNAGVTSSFT